MDVDIDINVKREDRVVPALKQGLKEGLEESGDWLMDEGEERAKDAVLSAERVWRGKLKQGFDTEEHRFNRFYHWKGKVENTAPHAGINERGLKPGSSPSVQDIIPWVDDKVSPNPETQERAANSDVNEWDPALQSLAAEYTPGTVLTAFAIREELEDEGYPGIGFMATTESYLKSVGPMIVHRKVEKHMNRELRKAGLK